MSAFLCSADHIAALAWYLHHREPGSGQGRTGLAEAQEDARVLAAANLLSLDCRYGDSSNVGGADGFLDGASHYEFQDRCAARVADFWNGEAGEETKPIRGQTYSLSKMMSGKSFGECRAPAVMPGANSIANMAHCLEYQACEFDTYYTSPAHAILHDVCWRAATDDKREALPVTWEWSGPKVAV